MTTAEDIEHAISVLMETDSVDLVDRKIEALLEQVALLKRARSLLAKPVRSTQPKAKAMARESKLGHWSEIEEKVYTVVNDTTERMTCKDVAEALGLSYVQIGKAVSSSQRLAKEGSYITVI